MKNEEDILILDLKVNWARASCPEGDDTMYRLQVISIAWYNSPVSLYLH